MAKIETQDMGSVRRALLLLIGQGTSCQCAASKCEYPFFLLTLLTHFAWLRSLFVLSLSVARFTVVDIKRLGTRVFEQIHLADRLKIQFVRVHKNEICLTVEQCGSLV